MNVNLKIITALLNSNLLDYYFTKKMITNADVFPYIKGIHLKKLPIKFPKTKKSEVFFESLVNEIILNKKVQKDIIKLNSFVYRLYDLTYDEVKVVDPEFGLTEEEYAAIKID